MSRGKKAVQARVVKLNFGRSLLARDRRIAGRLRLLRPLKEPVTLVCGIWILIILVLAIFGRFLIPHDPTALNLESSFAAPSRVNWFGTDQYGRDILSRVMAGAQYALLTAAIVVAVAMPIGSLVGLTSGFYGRWVDTLLMRVIDGWLAFPSLILAMAVAVVLQPNVVTSSVAIGLAAVPWYARTVRSETLTIRTQEFVAAAECLGARSSRIFLSHILPNVWGPILVLIGLQIGYAILTFAGLSFIGLGAQPPTAEWGIMITDGQQYTLSGEWWISVFPGLAIALTVIAFNTLGDALRDILDPGTRS